MSPFEACFGFEPVVPSMIAASRLLGFHVAYERDGGDDEFVEHMSKVRELLGRALLGKMRLTRGSTRNGMKVKKGQPL